jgi:hypothetical protein
MFRSQVLPLKANRSIRVQADCSRLAADVILSSDARGGQPASS